jgi:ATPase family associated with various cellular activities (AAA)
VTFFRKVGNTYRVVDDKNLIIEKKLPPGNYNILIDPMTEELYFQEIDKFTKPGKIYGDMESTVNRILNTFLDREAGTGVLLSGSKGSGKSLLSKLLSIKGLEKKIPTIVITSPWRGDSFNKLIQSVNQPAVVLFEEFEKTYKSENQEELLTLLDGVFPSQKLFVFTSNDSWKVDFNMKNRPGRIFYFLDFEGLSVEFIEEYCNDKLINKEYSSQIGKLSILFRSFNFDMLKGLVEEMNRYNETPLEALKFINVRIGDEEKEDIFEVTLTIQDKLIKKENLYTETVRGSPMMKSAIDINYFVRKEDGFDDDLYANFLPEHLVYMNAREGIFSYKNSEGNTLSLKHRVPKIMNLTNAYGML